MKKLLIYIVAAAFLPGCQQATVEGEEQATGTQAETLDNTPEVKAVEINGDRLHYVDLGEGETVIFVHGTIGDYRGWIGQVEPFSREYRVISYSRRYAYPNRQDYPDTADYSVDIHANDLISLIEELDLGKVHLVGHSYGAYTSLLAATRRPDLIRSMTLGEPPALLGRRIEGQSYIKTRKESYALVESGAAFSEGNDEEGLAIFIGAVSGDSTSYDNAPVDVKRGWKDNLRELRGIAMRKQFVVMDTNQLKELDVPTLLITGDNTTDDLERTQKQLNKLLPDVQWLTLENATHGLHFDNPAQFNAEVLKFIEAH